MSKKKRYTLSTACPQCGCSYLKGLTPEEIKEKFGHVPNAELECHECVQKFTVKMEDACPEWDKDCKK